MKPFAAWGFWTLSVFLAALALWGLTDHALGIESTRKWMATERHRSELMRTALWRLESAALPLLARESLAFDAAPGEFVRMHLVLESGGQLSSPEAPESGPPSPQRALLEQLRRQPEFLRGLRELPSPLGFDPRHTSQNDYAQRQQNLQQIGKTGKTPASSEPPAAPMTPLWSGGHLVLARRNVDRLEASLIDTEGLCRHLEGLVRDIFPTAQLARLGDHPDLGSSLAALPLSLESGPPASVPPDEGAGTLRSSLVLAWGGLSCAALASGFLLWGALRLSERRRDFVTAVTHELRTPLTSLKLHTDLLADPRTPPERHGAHISMVSQEAQRLAHLVENVLSYSRLERARRGKRDTLSVTALLERPLETIRRRMTEAGFTFTLVMEPGVGDLNLETDPEAVSRILLNLADNALKYAASGRLFRMEIGKGDGLLRIRCSDAGPGMPRGFDMGRPFAKSASKAASSAPGVGLGLPMCQRLARQIGGSLRLESGPGTSWTLALPVHSV